MNQMKPNIHFFGARPPIGRMVSIIQKQIQNNERIEKVILTTFVVALLASALALGWGIAFEAIGFTPDRQSVEQSKVSRADAKNAQLCLTSIDLGVTIESCEFPQLTGG